MSWRLYEKIPIICFVARNRTINGIVIARKDENGKINMDKSGFQHQYPSTLKSYNMKKKKKDKIFRDMGQSQTWSISDTLNLE